MVQANDNSVCPDWNTTFKYISCYGSSKLNWCILKAISPTNAVYHYYLCFFTNLQCYTHIIQENI